MIMNVYIHRGIDKGDQIDFTSSAAEECEDKNKT
jgi:hypothetical protein